MDFLFYLIIAIIGGVIGILFGWDPYKLLGQAGAGIFAILTIPFIIAIMVNANNINASTNILNSYITFWSNNFVDIILTDLAGQLAGSLLSPFIKR